MPISPLITDLTPPPLSVLAQHLWGVGVGVDTNTRHPVAQLAVLEEAEWELDQQIQQVNMEMRNCAEANKRYAICPFPALASCPFLLEMVIGSELIRIR